ncbi:MULTISPECIES: homoprotocatechuate degradation operon regulator HpaR [Delftia]|uniref:homoprotocatechuate degradation operon regulator HpaR n=1 Tax=Delftia TaxID=80865 RepID=UPI0008EC9498|nr:MULTISPECIES: homoprotocatechuate degradation operon regulator HpaR [Delftia]SFB46948.1 homoprotocatechuate degradation operon regulator, HpaR [Delftia tsuruhatensis]
MPQTTTSFAPESLRAFSRSLPMALLRARESVMVRFRPMLRAHGLTEQQWRVLRAMAAVTHRLRPMELSQATYISMPSLSRLLKTLEGRQLVERSRHASDMRGAEFELTAAGHAIVAEIAPHSSETYAEIERLVGHEEIEQLYALLDQVVQRLGAADGSQAEE